MKGLPPNGFTAQVHHLDARVGGTFKSSFTNFSTGKPHSFGVTYLDQRPRELLRDTDTFDYPFLSGQMSTTVTIFRGPAAAICTSCKRAFPT